MPAAMIRSIWPTKIVELLDDPQQRERMGRFGMERVERELSWEHEVPRLLRAYDRLFQDSRSVARHT